MIYFTSDLHFNHDREFVYKVRGFEDVKSMNEAIVSNWNNVVKADDEVYVLGDLMLNDNEDGERLIKLLNGRIHVVLGNHDTDTRRNIYESCQNIVSVSNAETLKYRKYYFFMTHYPSITTNEEKVESLKQCTLNLYGHTHQKDNFFQDNPLCYHVGVDSHNLTPVCIDDIIKEMEDKFLEHKKDSATVGKDFTGRDYIGRDPKRIDPFLNELGKIWKHYPDLRFGQLLMNINFNKDPFYVEEDEFLEMASKLIPEDKKKLKKI